MSFLRTSKPAEPQTASEYRAALATAKQSAEQINTRLRDAQIEVQKAQERYDAGAAAFAIGESKSLPPIGDLKTAGETVAALRNALDTMHQRIAKLTTALNEAEQAEAVDVARQKLPEMTARYDAHYIALDAAIDAFTKAERSAYNVLFDRSVGLCQPFSDPDIAREALILRNGLRRKLLQLSAKYRVELDPCFQTPAGDRNLGDPTILNRRIFL